MLFVDRFLQTDRGRTFDLASGLEVSLTPVPIADRAALDAWMRRSAALLELSCASLVPLVDFGIAGHGRYFEALGCRRPCACWGRRDEATASALVSLVASLRGRGLSAGILRWCRVVEIDARPMVLPDETTGLPLSDGASTPDGPEASVLVRETESLGRMLAECGALPGAARRWRALPRRAGETARSDLAASWREVQCRLLDVLETGVSGAPRSLALRIPSGALPPVVNLVARVSRIHGYIPVHGAIMRDLMPAVARAEEVRELLRGRHVLVIVDRDADRLAGEAAAKLFVGLGLDSHRPHVLLRVCADTPWSYRRPDAHRRAGLLAREHEAGYAGRGQPAASPAPPACSSAAATAAPSPARLPARPRTRVAAALENASKGRHALAARMLRETLGMQARRSDRPGAGESALALGRVLLGRGQVAEAGRAFEQARVSFDEAGMTSHTIHAAVFVGLAWTDDGRWLEAEAAIRAALIAARATADDDGAVFAGLALARCLLWQQRHREALEALPADPSPRKAASRVSEAAEASPVSPDVDTCAALDLRVVRGALEARIAIERDDLRGAGAAAAAARERAALAVRPADVALACTALAQVHAALGDRDALQRRVAEGLEAARLAHDPLRALRLRLALADGLLRAGKATQARSLLARLGRLKADRLPVVVQRRLEQVLESRRVPGGADGRLARGRLTGEANADARTPTATIGADVVEVVVEVLGYCQSIDDEDALSRKVVATVRARTRAVVMACLGVDETGGVVIAADGREPHPIDVARRAVELGVAVAPSATSSRLEAAVPVRFAGQAVGALACRWPADAPPDWPIAEAVLCAAAAALAPCVRSVLDRRAARPPAGDTREDEIVGVSAGTETLRAEIARAARAPFNVVIEGESGSGKELVARAIHRLGPRRHHRLCAINCAALTDELLEAELFGHARGAFTGAVAERKGLFEEADGGSLVLDEIGELTPRAQAKLLRAIQEGEIRRLGENFARPVDVRILAASNRALRPAAEAGAFRRDLLYRLEVIRIVVPPLRERVDDIPILAARFWQQATARLGSRATLAPATVAALGRYEWPGNVRELQNVLAALAVGAGRRGSVGPERLPAVIARQAPVAEAATLDEARRVFEARFVRAALARAGGRRAQAARDLGLTRQGLSKLLARLEIAAEAGSQLA